MKREIIITIDPKTAFMEGSNWGPPEYHIIEDPAKMPWRCRLFGHKWIKARMSEDSKEIHYTCARCPATQIKRRMWFIGDSKPN